MFSSLRAGERYVWQMDLDGRHLAQLTRQGHGSSDSKLLSDGQTLVTAFWDKEKNLAVALMDPATNKFRLYVYPFDGGAPRRAFDLEGKFREAKWTRDGKALVFARMKGDTSELVRQPIRWQPGTYPGEIPYGNDLFVRLVL